MPAYKCNECYIKFPHGGACLLCGGKLEFNHAVNPDTNWEQRVNKVKENLGVIKRHIPIPEGIHANVQVWKFIFLQMNLNGKELQMTLTKEEAEELIKALDIAVKDSRL